jgi:pSer/pThr/pTyr-binding forkhead associated (FHA) protein
LKNYYAILEVPVGCSLEEIRQAYHRLAQAHLDDGAAFAELKEAYEVLSTPLRRAEYDRAAWGETFSPAAQTTLPPMQGTAGRCPMGPEAQCPVVQGRSLPGDTFCPDCGYALAGLTPETAFDTAVLPDPARQARLEDAAGQTYLLKPGSNTVGREGTDVLAFDKTVSRTHARLEAAEDGTVSVEDFSSTNGTRVNGERLMPHALRRLADGDRVEFGSVSFVLRLPESAVSPSAAEKPTSGARAQVVETQAGGRAYLLMPGLTTFGRRPENMVVISGDLYVSGSHAQIRADGDEFIVTDIGSTNGTLLNGERLSINTPAMLDSGDILVIGATALRFERLSPSGEVIKASEDEAPEDEAPEESAPTNTATEEAASTETASTETASDTVEE